MQQINNREKYDARGTLEHASQESRNHRFTELRIMDQETRWLKRYQEVVSFIETNRRNPSKHRIEEHDMLNWVKANRKALNAGKMKSERIEAFEKILALIEEYKRVNQYV